MSPTIFASRKTTLPSSSTSPSTDTFSPSSETMTVVVRRMEAA